jgi:hypothetical protein
MIDPSSFAYIHRAIRAAYESRAAILSTAMEIAEAEAADPAERTTVDAAAISDEIDAAAAAALQDQVTWPSETDSDRLDRAFAALEQSHVIARQDFTCCQSCGHAEIWDEVGDEDDVWRGYVFFHSQDTDRAIDGGGLYLGYGSATGEQAATTAIGDDVVAALRAVGLSVTWDGSLNSRIRVEPFEWRRRLDPEDFPAGS